MQVLPTSRFSVFLDMIVLILKKTPILQVQLIVPAVLSILTHMPDLYTVFVLMLFWFARDYFTKLVILEPPLQWVQLYSYKGVAALNSTGIMGT